MSLLNTMKQIAAQANEVNPPAAWMFGEVEGVDPLTVRVDNRFQIWGDMLVVPRELRGGEALTHTHTILPHSHTVPSHSTQAAGDHNHSIPDGSTGTAGNHSHPVAPLESQKTALETDKEIHGGFSVGEMLILLRNQGGQRYLVLGRL